MMLTTSGKTERWSRGQEVRSQLLLFKDLVITYVLVCAAVIVVLYVYGYIHHTREDRHPQRPGGSTGSLGAGVTGSCECQKPSLGSLKDQYLFVIAEPPL